VLGNEQQMAVALCGCCLGRVARHCRGTRRHDDGPRGMTLGDSCGNALLVIRAVAGMEPISPSVCRSARRNTALSVSAVKIARGEYQRCPPRVVRGSAFQAARQAVREWLFGMLTTAVRKVTVSPSVGLSESTRPAVLDIHRVRERGWDQPHIMAQLPDVARPSSSGTG
jgi:hypothetical protein